MKELNQKLAIVQTKLKTKKTSFNAFGKYYFRKAEDILEAIKPFLLEQGVTVKIDEEIISGYNVPIIKSTATISDGKDAIHAQAIVGVDLLQKGMATAQQFGAASSYGKKYALGNLFLIDDTQDSDATNDHGLAQKHPKQQSFADKGSSVIERVTKPAITAVQWQKAKDFIKSGGSVDAIKSKYKLTTKQENELNSTNSSAKEA